MIISNPDKFIEDYIQDLNKDLIDAIICGDGSADNLKIKLNTACEIAECLGAHISKNIEKIEIPHVVCEWDD